MIKTISSFTVFTIENLTEAKTFYTKYFGFDIAFENEWYLHLVSEADIQVGFMLPNQPTQPEIFQKAYNGDGIIFSLEVEDVKSAYAEANAQSLDIVLELRAEDWGQHHFSIKDPNGIYVDIIESFEPTEEYQQGYDTK